MRHTAEVAAFDDAGHALVALFELVDDVVPPDSVPITHPANRTGFFELEPAIAGSEWLTTPGGHASIWEHPEPFNQAVLAFIERQR